METTVNKQKLQLAIQSYSWKTKIIGKEKLQSENKNYSWKTKTTVWQRNITVCKQKPQQTNKSYNLQTETTVGKTKITGQKKLQKENNNSSKTQNYSWKIGDKSNIAAVQKITIGKQKLLLLNKNYSS